MKPILLFVLMLGGGVYASNYCLNGVEYPLMEMCVCKNDNKRLVGADTFMCGEIENNFKTSAADTITNPIGTGNLCTADTDKCNIGLVCSKDFKCLIPAGNDCTFDGACESNICNTNKCEGDTSPGKICTNNNQCVSRECKNGICLSELNQVCSSSIPCASTWNGAKLICFNDKCKYGGGEYLDGINYINSDCASGSSESLGNLVPVICTKLGGDLCVYTGSTETIITQPEFCGAKECYNDGKNKCKSILNDYCDSKILCKSNLICENKQCKGQEDHKCERHTDCIQNKICQSTPSGKICTTINVACFHSTSHFYSQNSIIHGKDLTEGTIIKTGPDQYEPILFFSHYKPDVKTHMIQLTLDDNTTITTSHKHYLYLDNHDRILMQDVKVGDRLLSTDQPKTVIKIDTVETTGLINPRTYSGTVVVDGVIASCYTDHFNPTLAHLLVKLTYYLPGKFKTWFATTFSEYVTTI